jgi:predicted  nucleic acid-binding Zn-ribbon protein
MHPSQKLYQLQTLDLERDAKYRRLKAVIASLDEPETLRDAATALNTAQAQVTRARTQRRDLELEIQTLEGKITSVEERLYSGRVKNPKELSDLQNDAASLQRRHSTLDDALLEAMLGLEDAEQIAAEAQKKLTALQAEWQSNQKALEEERSQLETAIAALTEQRRQMTKPLPADQFATYQQLRHAHAGLTTARIEEGMCGVCGVEISDRLLAKASRSDDLSFCGNCGRILLIE